SHNATATHTIVASEIPPDQDLRIILNCECVNVAENAATRTSRCSRSRIERHVKAAAFINASNFTAAYAVVTRECSAENNLRISLYRQGKYRAIYSCAGIE